MESEFCLKKKIFMYGWRNMNWNSVGRHNIKEHNFPVQPNWNFDHYSSHFSISTTGSVLRKLFELKLIHLWIYRKRERKREFKRKPGKQLVKDIKKWNFIQIIQTWSSRMIPAKPALIYPLTVRFTFMAFPYPLSPSPMTGMDTAWVICCPWSTISP